MMRRTSGTAGRTAHRPSIVLGVTSSQSLRLMVGFPEYLASQGWDVHVVTAEIPTGLSPTVQWHALPMTRDPSPLNDLVSLARWIRLLARIRPNVVVSGTPKAGLLGMLAAATTRVPVRVYLLRGLRLESEAGKRRVILGAMERLTARSATRVQSVSRSLTTAYAELGLCDPDKIDIVGEGSSNGVEIGALTDAARSHQPPIVGFVGRMHPDKGVATLMTAAAQLAREGVDFRLLLVGPEEPAGYVAECVRTSDFPEHQLTWLGPVSDPSAQYREMDVLCLPSRREGFPNVVLEAAAQGVPAVVTDVTGCRDAVVAGETGWIVAPDDSGDLARALREALSDEHLRTTRGSNAHDRAVRQFAREHVWRLNEQYYRQLNTKTLGAFES